jgi:hypothetical protein
MLFLIREDNDTLKQLIKEVKEHTIKIDEQ